ncbi:MAG: sugar phosphate nucleotidyltransferase [Candidatus Peribacteraceae bacterium]|nr:sugar phosphate nucleotidyltransferase [Candidatus Peribacteraceae bacterium]
MQCTHAILPVAGLGTRFLPWTKAVPKELLPVGNRPMIALLVDECLSVGITDICLVISPGKEAIAQYFAPSPTLETLLRLRGKSDVLDELARYDQVRIEVAYQHEQRGDGHALLQAGRRFQERDVAVLFGDDYILGEKSGLQQLVQAYDALPQDHDCCVLCLEDVPPERISLYGVVSLDTGWKVRSPDDDPAGRIRKINGLVEKPPPDFAPSSLGVVGRYIIPAALFRILRDVASVPQDGEIRLIDALNAARTSMNIYGCIVDGVRLDTGTPAGYRHAVAAFERRAESATGSLRMPQMASPAAG